ncbi:MAG: DUF1854 domain-containing protein [Rhodocyclaceae bacterium]|nr:DUF1854 domain-containing protein [Rhodocyclaceae bacterium]
MSNDLLSFHRTYSLRKDAFGNLELVWSDHPVIERVTPVRPFPFSDPEDGLSFVDSDGHEVLWLDSINDLNTADRTLVDDALAVREFMPVITRIDSVSSFNTPSTWQVQTAQGKTQLVLKGEEHIRRINGMGGNNLLISDNHGIQFLIKDVSQLDKHSRRLLDRFL